MVKTKKFPGYTKSGLGLTKTGRLMIPIVNSFDNITCDKNKYGQTPAHENNKICMPSSNGMITKNNFGTVNGQQLIDSFGNRTQLKKHDGTIASETSWTTNVYVLSDAEYSDILEHYGMEK